MRLTILPDIQILGLETDFTTKENNRSYHFGIIPFKISLSIIFSKQQTQFWHGVRKVDLMQKRRNMRLG